MFFNIHLYKIEYQNTLQIVGIPAGIFQKNGVLFIK